MPSEIGRPYSITWRGKVPGMLERDQPVWWRFLDTYGKQFKALYYDCMLGGAFLPPGGENDSMLRMWRDNTAKRVDAIAELDRETWIIEVAAYPGIRSLGQLHLYQTLWIEDPKIIKPERLCLVCERIDNDLGAALGKFGISLFIV